MAPKRRIGQNSQAVTATQTAPIYISEIAPPKWRGALNIMFQFSTTAGILIASGINYGVPLDFPGITRLQ